MCESNVKVVELDLPPKNATRIEGCHEHTLIKSLEISPALIYRAFYSISRTRGWQLREFWVVDQTYQVAAHLEAFDGVVFCSFGSYFFHHPDLVT